MLKKYVSALSLIVLAWGCGRNDGGPEYALPAFPAEEAMVYEIVHDDLIIPSLVFRMDVYKDYLVMVYIDRRSGKWVHIHDKHTGEKLASGLSLGRGPKEIIVPISYYFDRRSGELSIYGEGNPRLMIFSVDSLMDGNFEPRYVQNPIFDLANMDRIYPLGEDKYLLRMSTRLKNEYKRFVLLKEGQVAGQYDEYPTEDQRLMNLAYSFSFPVSPDGRKFAIGSSHGWILEFFDLTRGIERERVDYYREPFWEEDQRSIDAQRSGYGFMNMTCDDKYVYAASGEPGTKRVDIITIFDWEGNPVKILRSEGYRALYPLAADTADGDLYAYTRTVDGEHHLIRIKPFPQSSGE